MLRWAGIGYSGRMSEEGPIHERTRPSEVADARLFRRGRFRDVWVKAGCLGSVAALVVLAAMAIGGLVESDRRNRSLIGAGITAGVIGLGVVVWGSLGEMRSRRLLNRRRVKETRFAAERGVRVRRERQPPDVADDRAGHLVLILDRESALVLPTWELPSAVKPAAIFSGVLLAIEGDSSESRLGNIEGPQAAMIVADDRTHAWIEACEVGEVVQIADMPRELREACERAIAG